MMGYYEFKIACGTNNLNKAMNEGYEYVEFLGSNIEGWDFVYLIRKYVLDEIKEEKE